MSTDPHTPTLTLSQRQRRRQREKERKRAAEALEAAEAGPVSRGRANLVTPSLSGKIRLEKSKDVRPEDVEWHSPGHKRSMHTSVVYSDIPCQHPKTKSAGVCDRRSVGEFPIPDSYIPESRHSNQPDIPRPSAFLCKQHDRMVKAHVNGVSMAGNSHEMWCDICNNPKSKLILDEWMRWEITVEHAVAELQVTHRAFYAHVDYFNLTEVKSSKTNLRRMLVRAAERGFGVGDHNVRTALKAVEALRKERMEDKPRKVDLNVSGSVGLVAMDLTKLSDVQLAEHLEALAKQVREGSSNGAKQITNGGRSEGGAVIDLPRESVKVLDSDHD